MTRDQYIIRRKLNMVELGEVLGNVSEACRRLSVSRQHYYDIKKTLFREKKAQIMECYLKSDELAPQKTRNGLRFHANF